MVEIIKARAPLSHVLGFSSALRINSLRLALEAAIEIMGTWLSHLLPSLFPAFKREKVGPVHTYSSEEEGVTLTLVAAIRLALFSIQSPLSTVDGTVPLKCPNCGPKLTFFTTLAIPVLVGDSDHAHPRSGC